MATKLTEIPIPPGFTADEADFYRRGFQDGEKGVRKDMTGYPDDLKLAYFTGGFDGSLAARPPAAAKTAKAHVTIPPHPRSLCGLAPTKGNYRILDFAGFFAAPDEAQCTVCLQRVASKGYSIKQLRRRYRAEHAQPQLQLAA